MENSQKEEINPTTNVERKWLKNQNLENLIIKEKNQEIKSWYIVKSKQSKTTPQEFTLLNDSSIQENVNLEKINCDWGTNNEKSMSNHLETCHNIKTKSIIYKKLNQKYIYAKIYEKPKIQITNCNVCKSEECCMTRVGYEFREINVIELILLR